jgi:CMP-N-acetylneuraminic acid synthetase
LTITAFLPCRAGSQRVPHKNTKPFGGHPEGLLGIKLRQLLDTPELTEIVLSTNDPLVIEIGERYLGPAAGRLRIDRRPDELCSSATSTDEVIAYVPRVIPSGTVLWTHVTSPFFGQAEYSEAIALHDAAVAAGTHDSLMGVLEVRTFLWDANGPINYDRDVEKWPRTQTLPALYEINSSVFIAGVEIFRRRQDRIGDRPYLYPVDKAKSLDVDWEEDFSLASELWSRKHG